MENPRVGRVLIFGPAGQALVATALALTTFVIGVQAQAGRQGGAVPQPAQAAPQPLPADAPFTVAVATSTLEAAPVYHESRPRATLWR